MASIILLATAVILIRSPAPSSALRDDPSDPRAALDSAGILQATWLLGNEPHLAKVETPTLHALRVAGMFEVQSGRNTTDPEKAYGTAGEEDEGVKLMAAGSDSEGAPGLRY